MNIPALLDSFGRSIRTNSPQILSGLAVAGVVSTGYLAHRAGFNFADFAYKHSLDRENEEGPTAKEIVDSNWKYYLPPLLTGLATVACVIGAHTVHQRRQTALISMVALSERALSEYREKTREVVGDKRADEIQEKAVQAKMDRNPDVEGSTIILSGEQIRAYDVWSDRYFTTDVEAVKKAMNDINAYAFHNMYASLNMFYGKLGLADIPMGHDFGWNMDYPLELMLSYHGDERGRPYMSIDFRHKPRQDYSSLH